MTKVPSRARSRAAAAALILLGSVGGCGPAEPPESSAGEAGSIPSGPREPAHPAPPPRPLTLARPPEPPRDGVDPAKIGGRELASAARRLAASGEYREAARLEYWTTRGGSGTTYELACWTALAGDVAGAFYWLQEAALDDGVDASWAAVDPDLATLRADARWKRVGPFLGRCNAYWAASGHRETVLIVPSGYRPGTPIGVVVGMHGMGDRPDRFLDARTFQPLADELGLAFVGVSGTVAAGRHKFVWSEDPRADAAQIHQAIGDLAGRLTEKPGHRVALGFSQGAQLGYEVAFRDPATYRGAIVISPGASNRFHRLAELRPAPANHDQGFVCLCGDGEAAGNLDFTRADADHAGRAGARVELRLASGQSAHAFPADFSEKLAAWLRFVDGEPANAD